MKVTKRDIGLLILLLGIISIILSYNFLYQKNLEKKTAEEAKLVELQSTEKDLAELEANRPFYESEIARMAEENEEIESHFPANILPENEIMYAVDLQNENDVFFSALSYGSPSEMTTGYENQTGIRAYDLAMSLSYQGTYEGVKNVILYNNGQDNRMVLNALTASFDKTTGNLSGSMTLDQYYMTGTNAVYAEPYVPAMSKGVDNIFGTFEIPLKEEAEAAEEAVPAEAEAESEGE